jgi:Mor family transcriptional regulator
MARNGKVIVKWTVEHEKIVAMHICQWSNEDIAEHFNLSKVQIYKVISDPQARKIINEAAMKIRSRMLDSLDEGMASLAVTAMKRISETLNFSDFVLGSDAKKHQDRLALDVIKVVQGSISRSEEEAKPLNEKLSKRLIEALEDSNAANELIKEGEFEVVGSE